MKLATAGLLIIEQRKLLLAYSRNKKCFYLPGGKIANGETPAKALCREILEEMDVAIDEHELNFYTHITAPAYGEESGIIMEQECFLLERKINPRPASEIGQLKYFSFGEYLAEDKTAPGAVMILQQLQNSGLID